MKRLLAFSSVVVACILLAACGGNKIKGDGKIVDQPRSVSGFDKLDIKGSFVVSLNSDQASPALEVKGDQNLQPYIMSQVNDNTLVVSVKRGSRLVPSQPIQLVINAKKIKEADLSGSNTFVADKLSGDQFDLEVAGESNVELQGKVSSTVLDLEGSAVVNAKGLQSTEVDVKVEGAGKVVVQVGQKLNVSIKGAGVVTYFGQPPVIQQEIYGGGKLIKGSS